MATTVMASAAASSLAFAATGARAGRFPARLPAAGGLAPRRRAALVVRAQAEDAEKSASPGLWDALAFSGPAPERINGRLAISGGIRIESNPGPSFKYRRPQTHSSKDT
jgi:hypothetical protein